MRKLQCVVSAMSLLLVSQAMGQPIHTGQRDRELKAEYDSMKKAVLAPPETITYVANLIAAGELVLAEEYAGLVLSLYPGDYQMRGVAFRVAFLLGKYEQMESYLQMPANILERFPMLEDTFKNLDSDSQMALGLAVASYSGVKVNRDQRELDSAVWKKAQEKKDSLPFEVATEHAVNTKPEVLALTLLMPSYGANGPRFLLPRIVKLAPNDTFVLELQAQQFARRSEWEKQAEHLKKAMNAPRVSKERRQKLAEMLKKAEHMVEYQKIIGPVKRPPPLSPNRLP